MPAAVSGERLSRSGSFWERCKFLAEFADYSDDADLAKSAGGVRIFLNSPVFRRS